jgi:uncharacterized protein (DUF433 family)
MNSPLAVEAGCYEASRAAALSGVPKSTVYHWARAGLIVPSISPTKEKLWSYSDLVALRLLSWLRHSKHTDERIVRASPMNEVRRGLALLDELGIDVWNNAAGHSSPLLVDSAGKVWIRTDSGLIDSAGQRSVDLPDGFLNLLAPFELDGLAGPDLRQPRPRLRIVPLKVAGEPHVVDSRITTRTLAALGRRGFTTKRIAKMYEIGEATVREALELEERLSYASAA